MLVSHLYKFIYLKSTKSAGTSVENYLEKYCLPEGEWFPPEKPSRRPMYESSTGIIGERSGAESDVKPKWYEHQNAADIKRQLGDEIWTSYKKVGNVRNPYDRAISLFYMLKHQQGILNRTLPEEQLEYEQWLVNKNYYHDYDSYRIDGVNQLDVIIRYETLSEDLKKFTDFLGLPFESDRLIKSGIYSRPEQFNSLTLYTDLGRKLMTENSRYERDTFGYSFPTSSFKCK